MAASAAGSAQAPNKLSPTANTQANRLPAPTLFVGPPSRNASSLSVVRGNTHDQTSKSSRDPLSRQQNEGESDKIPKDKSSNVPPLQKASAKRIEAQWKEMQSTLNEVELTAQSSTHVFGQSHAAALDTLRLAQVELARAWGRGNEEHAGDGGFSQQDIHRFKGADDLAFDRSNAHRKRGGTETSASTALSEESMGSDPGLKGGKSQLEDETAQDIKLASERRAANEAYFKKVDGGVRDVVAKLEAVAEAMRGVESESRSLWSNSEESSTVARDDGKGSGNG
ncbi:uncharacterized protein RCC_02511 [Ramularia collo-cygni]|uniref:Uncharacterized protein n=1 Tax=Ramularia collo-cygni TaxID=112498 RepID=A0A2D3UZK1_9PEZI|nr:uncharacterized protein RCC_02511 [Ramularia collo-cygni]CZT16676.1 uncharacterized protein RCC_02511 [Ramularia collo-cygni]